MLLVRSKSHSRSMQTVLLGLAVVFENLVLAGRAQASVNYPCMATKFTFTAIVAAAGGLFFLLLPALFGIRRKTAAQDPNALAIPSLEQDTRVALLEDQYRVLEQRYESLNRRYEPLKNRQRLLEDNHRMFFEDIPTPILVYDPETSALIGVNDAAIRDYGYSRDEFLSITLGDIQLGEIAAEDATENISAGDPCQTSARHMRKDGTVIRVETRAQRTVFDGREATALTVHDVTALRGRLEVLDRELQPHRALLNSLPGFVYARDRDGRFVLANMKVAASLGEKRPEDLIGKFDSDYQPEETALWNIAAEQEVMRTGRGVIEREVAVTDQNGAQTWLLETRLPWSDKDGDVAGVVGFTCDITERKGLEDQLGLMQFSIEHAGEAVYWLAPDLRLVYVNSAACHMLGYSREELLAMSLGDLDTRFPLEKWPELWEKMKHGNSPTFSARHTARDGRVIPVEVTSNYLGFNGREYSCTFVRDVSKRKQSEEALKRSLAELETIVSAVSESDLTKRAAEDETTLGRIAQSVNKMLGNFSDMITQVKGLGLTVSSSASQILTASEDIAVGLQRQAEEISDSSTAIEEMAASMSQVSRNAEITTEAAHRALEMAQRGDVAVNNTLQAMERIDVAVQLTATKMHTLAQRSAEISEILGMINGIAAQTNLLSLNAAIQAAHAGEAGLGFGVVADEIRKLAERSAQSTKDINYLNKAIQQETREALSSMDRAMKEVKDGSQLAKIAGDSIQDISVVVTESASLIEEISVAADEQARVSHSIAGAMQTVSNIATGTSSGTHQTSSIMRGLVSLVGDLSQTMLKFKIADNSSESSEGFG